MLQFIQQHPEIIILFAVIALGITVAHVTRKPKGINPYKPAKPTPYWEGARAYIKGLPEWGNPYSFITNVDRHNEWQAGWSDMEKIEKVK